MREHELVLMSDPVNMLILRHLANGRPVTEVMTRLGAPESLVRGRIAQMRKVLDARNSAELVAKAFRARILKPEMIRTKDEEGDVMTDRNDEARYAYQVEGVLTSGTLADYAKAWENTHYSGDNLSSTVMTWSGTHHTVRVRKTDQHNDYLHYELSANGETVGASLDGRA